MVPTQSGGTIEAFLSDFSSEEGFSGSVVFSFAENHTPDQPKLEVVGLIGGHLGTTGEAVIVPREKIRETLLLPELEEKRKQLDAEGIFDSV